MRVNLQKYASIDIKARKITLETQEFFHQDEQVEHKSL